MLSRKSTDVTNQNSLGLMNAEAASLLDVVIVGGGLSGTLAAILLGRRGLQVALVDRHDTYPRDFRAEQLVGSQVETLSRLELLDSLVQGEMPAECAIATRAGRTVGVVNAPHYGILYETMVNRARQHLPPSVRFIKARAVDVDLTADWQRVMLHNGDVVVGRLVVVATALGQRLLGQAGISKTMIRNAHSLAFGFDLEVEAPAMYQSSVLVAHGEQPAGAIDYLTLFLTGEKLRANLFTYGDYRSAWTKRFVREPVAMLRQALPGLEQIAGPIRAHGPVQVRVNDLTTVSNHRRDGIVTIGDAFQTSCPAAGTGIGRLLNDIDRLCNWYIPKWLTTKGMDSGKIRQFYDDPIKKRCDTAALRAADYRRSLITEVGLRWKIHRRRVELQNRVFLLARQKMWSNAGAAVPSTGATMAPVASPPAAGQSPR